ncbi:MAG: Na(+)-translocating NADH-quinone reductase subunit C [Rhodobacteraceae bacterium]|nr:Na(+)-translocating NADH-quinone reductase subunit C [Paracoccaceae bacterium]
MADLNPINWWRRFLALPNDNLTKTLGFAFLVAFTASIFVSVAAVTLKPLHLQNLERERQARMAAMVAALPGMADILAEAGTDGLEVRIVELASGTFARGIDAESFDQRAAALDPAQSTKIPGEADVAGLKQRANFAPVYILRRDGVPALVVLPVRGVGYQSMLYAYLALKADGNTVAGLTFYEHGETPGIGARIQDPDWQALWPGKELADDAGNILISVVRGKAVGPFEVDAISGATRTGSGVSNMLRFWLGEHGFGPFLKRLRAGEL